MAQGSSKRATPFRGTRKGGAAGKLLLAGAAVVVVVLAAVAIGGYVVFFTDHGQEAQPTVTLVKPASLDGRPQVAAGQADRPKPPGATAGMTGTWGDLAKKDVILVEAFAITGDTAEARLPGVVADATARYHLTGITPVEPGSNTSCGTGLFGDVPAAACVWTDALSQGIIVQTKRTAPELSEAFPGLQDKVMQVDDNQSWATRLREAL
jgi:hypothetical protein